jgi:hypothetical protein
LGWCMYVSVVLVRGRVQGGGYMGTMCGAAGKGANLNIGRQLCWELGGVLVDWQMGD